MSNFAHSRWRRRASCFAKHNRESGTALVFSLIILLIVTILGLTALRTSSLEQLMAGNTQEATRALEVADSGLEWILANPAIFGGSVWPQSRNYPQADPVAVATFGLAPSQVQIVGSGTDDRFAHFHQQVTGATVSTNVTRALSHGVRQSAPPEQEQFRDP